MGLEGMGFPVKLVVPLVVRRRRRRLVAAAQL
jgi:hypothetical protein